MKKLKRTLINAVVILSIMLLHISHAFPASYVCGAGSSVEQDIIYFGDETDNTVTGTDSREILHGFGGADTFNGMNNNDVLWGGDGNDTLNGANGSDTVYGEGGDDIIVGGNGNNALSGDDGNDNITGGSGSECIGGGNGIDVISAADGIDLVNGDGGNDTINGGLGDDRLSGGAGSDKFIFATYSTDDITDYSPTYDTIQIQNSVFTAVGAAGTLPVNSFYIGAAAHDADDRIIYNSSNGNLYYDADGTGATAPFLLSTMSTGLALTNADFVII